MPIVDCGGDENSVPQILFNLATYGSSQTRYANWIVLLSQVHYELQTKTKIVANEQLRCFLCTCNYHLYMCMCMSNLNGLYGIHENMKTAHTKNNRNNKYTPDPKCKLLYMRLRMYRWEMNENITIEWAYN